MSHSFEDAVNAIMQKHDEYAPDAYDFLRQALDTAVHQYKKSEQNRHLTAEELYMGVCYLAREEYGPLARTVLQYWGINDGKDVGLIVFYLIEAGVFGKQEDDSIEQFYRLPKLSGILDAPYLPQHSA